MRPILALIIMTFAVSACSNAGLRDLRSTTSGPDEFIVEPNAELEIPPDFRTLPTPTPGGTNRTDNDPVADAVIALGGRPGNVNAPIPASEGALVTASSRYGVTPNIRETLAAEDAEFRRKQSRFTQYRLFSTDLYEKVYQDQALNPHDTARAWQRAGTVTPSFPPSD